MNKTFRKTALLVGAFSLLGLCYSPNAYAADAPQEVQQAKKITGTVVDATGPVIGASVVVKGTSNGVATDFDGNFTLNASPGQTLVISYIGYLTKEIKITAAQSKYNVTLEEDKKILDEVVVVGYGTMKKSDISGASATVGESAIKGSLITSLDQALQGHAAGVSAVSTSGAPGSGSSIRVRGTATINANAEPLYVIDGVIVQSQGLTGYDYGLGDALGNGSVSTISPLSTIDPQDIVSMEILKDASATAIYGAQGANGVVLITTKHGKAGEAKFSYSGTIALNRQTKRLDILDLREYADYYNAYVEIGEATANPIFLDKSLLGKGTNWQDAVFQTALMHQHQVSAQGGTDKVRYYVSGSYMKQEGTIIGSEFNRLSARANVDADLKSWLKMGLNVAFSDSNDDLKLADGEEGIINYSLTTTPNLPIYDMDGNYASSSYEGSSSPNPIALALLNENKLNRQKLNGNIFFDVKFYKDLTWHTELGFDLGWSKADRYRPIISLATYHQNNNTASTQKNSNKFWQIKNYVTWTHNFAGKHNVTGMVGQEAWESSWDYLSASNTGLPNDKVHNVKLGTGNPTVDSGFGEASMASFFTRWTYSYNDRYNATYTYRYDGSSNFGPNKRWAGFHSFAASWRFNNESFMKDMTWLSNGKLRLGWGQTGNSSIGAYKWGVALKTQTSALGSGNRPANIANTAIQWESQEQFNVGLDLGVFNNRVNLTIDWYRKESKDMLMGLQLPAYMGTSGNGSSALEAPSGNYGTIRNTGLEITLNTHPIVGKFEWDSEFQISFNKNKLVALNDGTGNATLKGWGQWGDQEPQVSQTEVGGPLFSFYGYVCDGYYTSKEDIENSPTPVHPGVDGVYAKNSTVWVGDIKYKDLSGPDGVPDGKIDAYDRTDIGSPLPKFTFGWTNTFRWNNFDLNIFINGSYGNKVGNYNKYKLTHMNNTWINQLDDVLDATRLVPIDPNKDYSAGVDRGDGQLIWNWYDDINNVRIANPGASLPRMSMGDPNDNDRWSDRYIEDASYIRLKNISLGYTFPKKMVRKLSLETLRVNVNIQNLVTITGYDGYDPEVGTSTQSSFVAGLDNGRYPSPTTYSFGINVTF
jgi:TonB-linked SusC/RagA family outer membrane protein